jgi:hypothetical protein
MTVDNQSRGERRNRYYRNRACSRDKEGMKSRGILQRKKSSI